jgi:hypothetical protein
MRGYKRRVRESGGRRSKRERNEDRNLIKMRRRI